MKSIFEKKVNIRNCYNKLKKNGYVVLNSKIKTKHCNRYIKAIDKFTPKNTIGKVELSMCTNLLSKDFIFSEIVFSSELLHLTKKFFNLSFDNDLKDSFQLNAIHSRKIDIKSKAQNLHVDSKIPGIFPPIYATILIYLDDVDLTMGPTRVLPFSHRLVKLPKNKYEKKTKKLIGKKGTVIFLNSSIWHGASEKINDKPRRVILLTYNRWFVRQNFANPFNLPKKIVDSLTLDQKKILGFFNYPPISAKSDKPFNGKLEDVNKNFRDIFRREVKNFIFKK